MLIRGNFSRQFDQKLLEIEGAILFKRFYIFSQGSKTPKIWPKNDRLSAVLGHCDQTTADKFIWIGRNFLR